MKISTRTRYGLRLILELGINYGRGPMQLKDIAQIEAISEKYLSQIVITLRSAGLVESIRGANGGYILSRPPFGITLKDVVEVLEGGLNLVPCVNSITECTRITKCVTHDIWSMLTGAIVEALSDITVENLVKMYKRKCESTMEYTI